MIHVHQHKPVTMKLNVDVHQLTDVY